MISPQLQLSIARARSDDLRRAADAQRLARPRASPAQPAATVTLRFASAVDRQPLAHLAELGSSTPPKHPVLAAEVDGQLRAALGLTDGTVIADPFHETADLIDLLRARARQLQDISRIERRHRRR